MVYLKVICAVWVVFGIIMLYAYFVPARDFTLARELAIAETAPTVMEELILPRTHEVEVESSNDYIVAHITAYNPLPNQTDDTPFINAMGLRVQDGDIANNCLSFGSRVKIDDKIYTVRDRMNSRYDCSHFDIFLWDYDEAVKFGKQVKEVEIL